MPNAMAPVRLLIGQILILQFAIHWAQETCCLAQQPASTLDAQGDLEKNPLAAQFKAHDSDGDGQLTEEEFVARGGRDVAVLRRDFKVFDFNGDGRLSLAEFLALPYLGPHAQRAAVPDPVVLLAESRWKELNGQWTAWDKDGDGMLSPNEFSAAGVGRGIPGLETTRFDDWDLNHDGKVSREESKRLLEIAYGICLPTGELLRLKTGSVVDWFLFRRADQDGDGQATRDDYFKVMGHVPDWEGWYKAVDRNNDGKFDYAEFAGSNHRTDPAASFLAYDADLDGRLSRAELESTPVLRPIARYLFPSFDDDGDGLLSLREYQFTPIPTVDVLAPWQSAQDADRDGRLSQEEFRFVPGLPLAALSAEYFRKLDRDKDGFVSLDEWPFSTSHPQAKFRVLDADSDGMLTESEFTAEGSLPADRLRRDFKTFDWNDDGRLSLAEFLTLPYWIPEDLRGAIRDSTVVLADSRYAELIGLWGDWDRDGDGSLAQKEFSAAAPGRRIPGLEMTGFDDWDLNRDRKVTQEEARLILEIAYGIRSQKGELLRFKTGSVIDWQLFRRLDPDGDGIVTREEYFKGMQGVENLEGWYQSIDKNNDGNFDFAEFAGSNHRTDPVGTFLAFDKDLSGGLTRDELETLPDHQRPLAKYFFPGFDDNGDGAISLQELLLTPLPTLHVLASWQSAQDMDHDGKLSPGEFHFMPPPALAALSAEYFRRLDANKDGFLDLHEWVFIIDAGRVPRNLVLQLKDRNGDGRLSFEEVAGDLKRPQPGDQANPGQEAALLRIEEAFRRADVNGDGLLDLQELSTADGLEAIAPGAAALSKNASKLAIPAAKFFGIDDANLQTYVIVGFNVLLVVAVAIYILRSKRQGTT